MIVRAIDSTNDWTYGKSLQDYKSNSLATGQLIQTRIQSFLGDCFFAITDGIDWLNLLGTKNEIGLNLAIGTVILNTQNVTGLVQLLLSLNPATRGLTIQYVVTTAFTGTNPISLPTINFLITQDGEFITTQDGDNIEV